ncbi:hypothetical protein [Rosenbergiella nectarea]|uniref:hypothetical protein n=1 Tax=Rosenbergiella nectarea TaxID=988801 RepID=UPI001BDB065B|nr:hypothetical protein [Rosenbergiella nectarea]MBT0730696.1 hypothetical protein [Rosenbergiella nectarea subsp. apis]
MLTVLGNQQPFTVQALIDCLQQAKCDDHDYGEIREKSMRHAIAILENFTEGNE